MGRTADEEVALYGGANRLCLEAGGARHVGGRGVPQDGRVGGDVFRWKQKFSGLGPSELRRLRQLEEENTKLRKLVADLSLDKSMLQDVLAEEV